jgi:micrococcal nuclease
LVMRMWVAGLIGLALSATGCRCDPLNPADVRVIDGDTIAVRGKIIYLVGFQAPERRGAQCKAERELGAKAARRVRDLILAGGLDYSPVACSCPPSRLGRWFCNLGRSCGTLKANGRDVGDTLVEEGLAVPFSCDETGCPKTPKPWCKSISHQ